MIRLTCVLWAVAAGGCAAGIQAPTHVVRGKVVFKGTAQPVTKFENGLVILDAGADRIVQGTIQDDGSFALGSVIDGKSLSGAPAGEYRVRVVPLPDDTTGRGNQRLINPKYLRFETSGLRLNVTGDMPDVTIEVEAPK